MSQSVLKALTGLSNCKIENESTLRSSDPSTFTAVISGASKIYSLFRGTVNFIGSYEFTGTLNIAVSSHEIIRYLNLTNMQVWENMSISKGTYLGDVREKFYLQFEYCTQWKGDSKYPIRVDDRTYFKQNPIDILDGLYEPVDESNVLDGINRPNDTVDFTSEQGAEWGVNKINQITVDSSVFQVKLGMAIPPSAIAMLSDNGGQVSSLVSYTKISPKKDSPRKHSIDTISIHCMAGQLSVEACGEVFQNREASSNYGIGPDGRIGLYVEEKDRSWCTSSASNDNRAVTIEVASDSSHPYKVTDAAYNSLIKLLVDICSRNGIRKLLWRGDKSLIGQVDKQNMTVHRWFSNKACPGDYLYNKHAEIANAVNTALPNAAASIGEQATGVTTSDYAAMLSTAHVMTNSSLATYVNRLSSSGIKNRTSAITAITIHSANATGDIYALSRMINSSDINYNYGIDNEGTIGLFVDESMASNATQNTYNDNRTVNIVCMNETLSPMYKISDACYESLLDLCEDICRRNYIFQLKFGEKSPQKFTFTMHRQFDKIDCPGQYIESLYPKIQTEVNRRINSATNWVTVTKRMANSESAALRVQSTISIGAIKPYVAKLDPSITELDIDKIREIGVVGIMLEAGQYYDRNHNVVRYRTDTIYEQSKLCTDNRMPFGMFYTSRAQSVDEAKLECEHLYYIISKYPPKLGIWVRPELNVDSDTAQSIIEVYYSRFVDWGLKSKCGIYASKDQATLIGWPKQCTYMALWLSGETLPSNIPQQEVLTPSFFKLNSLQNTGYNPTTTVLSSDSSVLSYQSSESSSIDGIGVANQIAGFDFTDKLIPTNPKYSGLKRWENYKSITSTSSLQYKIVNSPKAYTGPDTGFRMMDGRFLIAVGTGIAPSCGPYIDVFLENGTIIPCIVGEIKADAHTDPSTHIFTLSGGDNHDCTEFLIDSAKLEELQQKNPNSGPGMVRTTGDASYLLPEWKSKVTKIRVYTKNWFNQ